MKKMRERLLKLMRGNHYTPKNKSELARALGLASDERSIMRSTLRKMEDKGEITYGAKGRFSLGGRTDSQKGGKAKKGNKAGAKMEGTIKFQTKNNAWFYPDPNDPKNIEAGFDIEQYDRVYVDNQHSGVALDGDKVRVRVEMKELRWKRHSKNKGKKGKNGKKERRPALKLEPVGVVLEVLERVNTTLIGTYRERGNSRFVEPDFQGFPGNLELERGDNDDLSGGAKNGHRVVVKLLKWTSKFSPPIGTITDVLGFPEAPGVDIVSVIHKHNLRTTFSEEVMAEAQAIDEEIPAEEIARREDWRDELVLTVDPFDAKDYDDAILVRRLENGWELAVHIADVSHYVKPHSALDLEAQKRGNSTYLVDRVLPMLPEKISNNVCSLRSDVDRLTKCAVMKFDKSGKRTSARFCDAVIHSKARLSYEQAQEFLMAPGTGGVEGEALRTAWELASLLRNKRFADGALDLDFPEVKVLLDDDLNAKGVEKVIHNESHKMVEECMLAANEAVAVKLKMVRRNAVYRIHENPDFDKLNEFAETARAHGFKVGDLTNKKHIQDLLDRAKGSPTEETIKIGLLKSLKRAAYSTDPLGHYGLAKMDYCHFTSPIRRYADLIVHRALQAELENPPKPVDKNPKLATLNELATHISETERKSADAEIETKRMKMLEYLLMCANDDSKDADHGNKFEALVTDIRRMGLFVEISEMKIKGLVRVEDLPRVGNGYWQIEGLRCAHTGGKAEIKVGAKVQVEVIRVDTERNMVDFRVVEI